MFVGLEKSQGLKFEDGRCEAREPSNQGLVEMEQGKIKIGSCWLEAEQLDWTGDASGRSELRPQNLHPFSLTPTPR